MDFRKQNSNKAEETDSDLIERKTSFVNLTEWLRMTETGIRPSADSEYNEYGATAGKIFLRFWLPC